MRDNRWKVWSLNELQWRKNSTFVNNNVVHKLFKRFVCKDVQFLWCVYNTTLGKASNVQYQRNILHFKFKKNGSIQACVTHC